MTDFNQNKISVDLGGQVALVTGASRGIGKAIAIALGKSNARVACVARNIEKLNETANAIRDAGGTAEVYEGDVADSDSVQSIVDAVVEKLGDLHILVNNAGITRDMLVPRMSDEDWDQVIATNLRSVFLYSRAASQVMMRSKYGRIINISSVSGIMGNPGQANYSASKAGVIAVTKTLARELASRRRQITVNAICPGFIATEMVEELENALGDAMMDKIKQSVPAQRLGEASEIADAVLYLASGSAAFVNGEVLVVDGGLTA